MQLFERSQIPKEIIYFASAFCGDAIQQFLASHSRKHIGNKF